MNGETRKNTPTWIAALIGGVMGAVMVGGLSYVFNNNDQTKNSNANQMNEKIPLY